MFCLSRTRFWPRECYSVLRFQRQQNLPLETLNVTAVHGSHRGQPPGKSVCTTRSSLATPTSTEEWQENIQPAIMTRRDEQPKKTTRTAPKKERPSRIRTRHAPTGAETRKLDTSGRCFVEQHAESGQYELLTGNPKRKRTRERWKQ